MKLSVWAAQNGVTYLTAWRWFHTDQLPVPAHRLPSGAIMVDVPGVATATPERTALYARVSSSDQRADGARQLVRLRTFAAARGLEVHVEVLEIGSGLNGTRAKLRRLLLDPAITCLVVEHRDRLARFGVELVEAAFTASGRRVLVMNQTEVADDLTRDVTEVLTSLCARLYGKRGAANRAARALQAAETPTA